MSVRIRSVVSRKAFQSAFSRWPGTFRQYGSDRGAWFRLLDYSRPLVLHLCCWHRRRPGFGHHAVLRSWAAQPVRHADAIPAQAGGESRRLVLLTYVYAATVSALLAVVCLIGIRYLASASIPVAPRHNSVNRVRPGGRRDDNLYHSGQRAGGCPPDGLDTCRERVFRDSQDRPALCAGPGTALFAVFGAWMIPLTLTIPVISAVLFFRFLPRSSRARGATLLGRRARSKMVRFAIGDATGGLFTQAWTYLPPP